MKSDGMKPSFAVTAVFILTIAMMLTPGCDDANSMNAGNQTGAITGKSIGDTSSDNPTATLKKYFAAFLSGDCNAAIEMFDWDEQSPIDPGMKQEMLLGCEKKHTELASYEVIDEQIHEQASSVSAIVITRLTGTDLGEAVDENVQIPLVKVNGEWKMGRWMTWRFRPDSSAEYTAIPGVPAPSQPPPMTTGP